jgi:hypothetical protein
MKHVAARRALSARRQRGRSNQDGPSVEGDRVGPFGGVAAMRIFIVLLILGGVGCLLAGCSDPASSRRIARRNAALQETHRGIERSEQRRARRLGEMGPTLEKWHRQDEERFREVLATVGDYVW